MIVFNQTIIYALNMFGLPDNTGIRVCQNLTCSLRGDATRVCHHEECTQENNDMPLMLCPQCDLDIHRDHTKSGHFVLDYNHKVDNRNHNHVGVRTEDQATSTLNPLSVYARYADKSSHNRLPNGDNNMNGYLLETVPRSHSVSDLDIIVKSDDPQTQLRASTEPSGYTTDPSALSSVRQSKRRNTVPVNDGCFTLKFVGTSKREEELVEVAVAPSRTLRDAVSPVLKGKNIDINSINVFLEKSKTPLPMDRSTFLFAEKTLEIKEKEKVVDSFNSGIPRQSLYASKKDRPSLGTHVSSRRESMGVLALLLEAPPTKQRRGSLQLPFREHFFTKADSKNNESFKIGDDISVLTLGRQSWNTSLDDSVYTPPVLQGSMVKKNKYNKHPRFGSMNKDKERQDQFVETLKLYSLHGIPSDEKFDDNILDMESSWKLIVKNHENMTKKQQEHQEAVWELLQTEVSYIKQIRIIIDVFQNCLINVQKESYLNEIEAERMFSNIDKVFECNYLFWQRHLLPILQHSRESRQPLDPLLSKEGFVEHFPVLFQVYFKYLIEHKACLEYVKVASDSTDLFKIFIHWAETQNQCNRLQLAAFLIQPMSRLLKYSLLLKAIHKYTEGDHDRANLQAMIQSVDKSCEAANSSVRRTEEYNRLEAVSRTVEPFDSLEAPNDECAKIIQEYAGNFKLSAPMPGFSDGPRSLLYQSTLKMKEAQNAKIDVDCLLFTDLLLICKSNKKIERFKIIRPPMRLDQLIVNDLKDKGCFLLIYVNEYRVPISAFTFHSDAGAIRSWLDKFRQAQKEFKEIEQQMNSSKSRLRSDTASTQEDFDSMSVVSAPSYLEAIVSSIPRSDSDDSIDRFLPNLPTSNSTSNSSESEINGDNTVRSSRNYIAHSPAGSLHHVTDFKNVDHSPCVEQVSFNETIHSNCPNKESQIKTVESVQNNISSSDSTTAEFSQKSITIQNNVHEFQEETKKNNRYVPSVALDEFKNGSYFESKSTQDQNNDKDDDFARMKLNSRRSEKRYRTADEIPDIKNSMKDTSIHKWSSLRMDVQTAGPTSLRSTVLSTESLQSVPSSSGVSSTGSLQLTFEVTDELNNNSSEADGLSDRSSSKIDHRKHFSVDDTGDFAVRVDFIDGDSSKLSFSESKHSKSKSTSDLVEVFNDRLQVSHMNDTKSSADTHVNPAQLKLTPSELFKLERINQQIMYDANTESSADIPVNPAQWKLTPSEILKLKRMKQQILYDVNTESSEV